MVTPNLKYWIKPIPLYLSNTLTDINDTITNRDIEDIFRFPKIGKPLTLGQAYKLRLDLASEAMLSDIPLIGDFSMSLPHWANLNGYYIEFDENEIEILAGISV